MSIYMSIIKIVLESALKRLLEHISKSNDNELRYRVLKYTQKYEKSVLVENNDYVKLESVYGETER